MEESGKVTASAAAAEMQMQRKRRARRDIGGQFWGDSVGIWGSFEFGIFLNSFCTGKGEQRARGLRGGVHGNDESVPVMSRGVYEKDRRTGNFNG